MAEEKTELRFTGSIWGLNHAAICARLRRRHQPWLMRWGVLIAAGLYLVLLFALMVVANTTAIRLPVWAASYAPFAIFLAALILLLRWRRRYVWEAVRNAPVRSQKQEFTLSSEGLRVKGELSESLIRWPAVLEVIEDPAGLLLLTGQMEYITVPTEAFDDAEDMRQAAAHCRDWIAKTKPAP